LSGAIDADLYDFVSEANVQSLAQPPGVGGGKYDIARQNEADHLPLVVCNLLLTEVKDVDRDGSAAAGARWQHEAQRVTHAGECGRVMNCELALLLTRDRRRIPPDSFAPRVPCHHRLAHSHRLRSGGKKKKQSAFAAGLTLSCCGE
jgi:hypothetical protein